MKKNKTMFIELQNIFVDQQKQYEEKKEKITHWKEMLVQLLSDVEKLYDDFQKEYEASEIEGELPEQLHAKLENRREGIRLSVKGASRLAKKLGPVHELERIEDSFTYWESVQEKISGEQKQAEEPAKSEEQARDEVLIEQQIDEVKVEEIVNGKAEETTEVQEVLTREEIANDVSLLSEEQAKNRETVILVEEAAETEGNDTESLARQIYNAQHENQDLLDRMNELLNKMERTFVNFIEKSVAPVIDGLYNGAVYSRELPKEVGEHYPEHSEYVHQWLRIYQSLIGKMDDLLESCFIATINPEIGVPFDENTQEAIGVVEDATMENEQIKEIVRFGYLCEIEIYGQKPFLIRPAQVIVVKNGG